MRRAKGSGSLAWGNWYETVGVAPLKKDKVARTVKKSGKRMGEVKMRD